MSELWLVRHGESVGNVDGSQADTPLSPAGRRQAQQLCLRLQEFTFDRCYASPLLRAAETARIALPKLAAVTVPELRELAPQITEFVDPTRLSSTDMRELLLASRDASQTETGAAFRDRVRSWLAPLPRGEERLIAFSHAGVVAQLLAETVDRDGVFDRDWVGNCSVSRVRLLTGHAQLLQVDDRSHLMGSG